MLKLGMENLDHNFKASILTPRARSLALCPDHPEMLPVPRHVPGSQQEVLWSIFCTRPTWFLRDVFPPTEDGDREQWRNHSFLRQSSQVLHYLRSRKSSTPSCLNFLLLPLNNFVLILSALLWLLPAWFTHHIWSTVAQIMQFRPTEGFDRR